MLHAFLLRPSFSSSRKEQFDENIIDFSLHENSENQTELKTHIVYAGYYYEGNAGREDMLRSLILEGMKKNEINSVMATTIFISRWGLITKDKMERYCKGELDPERNKSVNDDLESFFEGLRLGKEPDENVGTYFLPKLTEEELRLVERKNASYLESFIFFNYADVDEDEMKLSESNSKFIEGWGHRRSFTIEIPNSPNIHYRNKYRFSSSKIRSQDVEKPSFPDKDNFGHDGRKRRRRSYYTT